MDKEVNEVLENLRATNRAKVEERRRAEEAKQVQTLKEEGVDEIRFPSTEVGVRRRRQVHTTNAELDKLDRWEGEDIRSERKDMAGQGLPSMEVDNGDDLGVAAAFESMVPPGPTQPAGVAPPVQMSHTAEAYLRAREGIPPSIPTTFLRTPNCPVSGSFRKAPRLSKECMENMKGVLITSDGHFCESMDECSLNVLNGGVGGAGGAGWGRDPTDVHTPGRSGAFSKMSADVLRQSKVDLYAAGAHTGPLLEALYQNLESREALRSLAIETNVVSPTSDISMMNVSPDTGESEEVRMSKAYLATGPSTSSSLDLKVPEAMLTVKRGDQTQVFDMGTLKYLAMPVRDFDVPTVHVRMLGEYHPLELQQSLPEMYRKKLQPVLEKLNAYRRHYMKKGVIYSPEPATKLGLTETPPDDYKHNMGDSFLDNQVLFFASDRDYNVAEHESVLSLLHRYQDQDDTITQKEPESSGLQGAIRQCKGSKSMESCARATKQHISLRGQLEHIMSATVVPTDVLQSGRDETYSSFSNPLNLTFAEYVTILAMYNSMTNRVFPYTIRDLEERRGDYESGELKEGDPKPRVHHPSIPLGVVVQPDREYGSYAKRVPLPPEDLPRHAREARLFGGLQWVLRVPLLQKNGMTGRQPNIVYYTTGDKADELAKAKEEWDGVSYIDAPFWTPSLYSMFLYGKDNTLKDVYKSQGDDIAKFENITSAIVEALQRKDLERSEENGIRLGDLSVETSSGDSRIRLVPNSDKSNLDKLKELVKELLPSIKPFNGDVKDMTDAEWTEVITEDKAAETGPLPVAAEKGTQWFWENARIQIYGMQTFGFLRSTPALTSDPIFNLLKSPPPRRHYYSLQDKLFIDYYQSETDSKEPDTSVARDVFEGRASFGRKDGVSSGALRILYDLLRFRELHKAPYFASLRHLLSDDYRKHVEVTIMGVGVTLAQPNNRRLSKHHIHDEAFGRELKALKLMGGLAPRQKGEEGNEVLPAPQVVSGKDLQDILVDYADGKKPFTSYEPSLGADLQLLLTRSRLLHARMDVHKDRHHLGMFQNVLTSFMYKAPLSEPLTWNQIHSSFWTPTDPSRDHNSIYNLLFIPDAYQNKLRPLLKSSDYVDPSIFSTPPLFMVVAPLNLTPSLTPLTYEPVETPYRALSLLAGYSFLPFDVLTKGVVVRRPHVSTRLDMWSSSSMKLRKQVKVQREVRLVEHLSRRLKEVMDITASFRVVRPGVEAQDIPYVLTTDMKEAMRRLLNTKGLDPRIACEAADPNLPIGPDNDSGLRYYEWGDSMICLPKEMYTYLFEEGGLESGPNGPLMEWIAEAQEAFRESVRPQESVGTDQKRGNPLKDSGIGIKRRS